MGVRSGKGDKGFTDLYFHKRISKDSPDIRAIGDLDELSCYLGLAKSKMRSRKDKTVIEKIQQGISAMSSEIVVGDEKKKGLGPLLMKEDTIWIEGLIFDLEKSVKIESCFYIPGDTELSALLDVARAIARRAERSVVRVVHKNKAKNDNLLSYLNCVSDVLFVLARKNVKGKRKTSKTVKKRKTLPVKRKTRKKT